MIIGGRFFLFHLLLLRLRHGECNEPGKCILSLVSRRQAGKIEGVQWEMKWISQQHAQHSTAVGINLSLQSHWVCDWRKDKPNAESVYYYNMTKQTMFFDFCYRSKPLHMAYSKKKIGGYSMAIIKTETKIFEWKKARAAYFHYYKRSIQAATNQTLSATFTARNPKCPRSLRPSPT